VYGSHAFGVGTERSDLDLRGVFVLPKRQFYCGERVAQISDARSNEVYWEVERFVGLLLKNNPSALETLAVAPKETVPYFV
jgi:predicted nucleotidyltransferase